MLKGLQIEKTMCSEYYLVDKLVFVRLKHKIVVNLKKKKRRHILCINPVLTSCLFDYCLLSFDSGYFDIIVNGKTVGKYDNKGSFGELALMYNQPRAATIVATSTGSLWAMVSYIHV